MEIMLIALVLASVVAVAVVIYIAARHPRRFRTGTTGIITCCYIAILLLIPFAVTSYDQPAIAQMAPTIGFIGILLVLILAIRELTQDDRTPSEPKDD